MNNHDYHLQFLQQAIADQPDPPCDSCCFMHQCVVPDQCTSYQIYIDNGVAVSPPDSPACYTNWTVSAYTCKR